MRPLLLIVALLPAAVLAADAPAPDLRFEAGAVLAGGHVLAEAVTLPAKSGPVVLKLREGADLHWRVAVEHGETRLLQPDGRWAAKAEYHRGERNGRPACLIYQTVISPDWAVRGTEKPDRADFAPADDRIYAFRETPCP
ncbi:MAG: hypothetical protein OJJ21_13445 [Ferrovibrio sp.]|uniref:hypothetical protein n=1 Tax=Ferrovibrio sp. TaxID=1917215 RepID=UPI002616EE21|nr:hypothetical protein [Ferrovibrio sp.]MCW0234599.1 hypothetical protein [Ferrovibrio sp.]